MNFSLFLVTFFLGLVLSSAEASNMVDLPINLRGKTWCVVTVSAPSNKLQAFINSTCKQLNCKEIQPGGSCYEPNTLVNHASYALDLLYRARGVCNSELGTPAVKDPSFGKCQYP